MSEKRPVSFDLETIASPACYDIMPEIKVNGNLKDPEKIKLDIINKKNKQILDMGMDPMTNMICCAGLYDGKQSHGYIIKEASPEAEAELLLWFWRILHEYDYNHFVTFNGRSFDLRCILLHGMEYGIQPSINIDKGKYNRGNHTDLRQVLAGSDTFAKGKLDFFCKKFLSEGKMEGIDGSMVQSYFEMELFDEIKKYGIDDATKTHRLYVKAERAGLLE